MNPKTISQPLSAPPVMGLGAGPDRLDSWKEIAQYLKREVRTVQLWEKKEGLPVHRHYHNRLGTVFAFRSEIEDWGRRRIEKSSGESAMRQGLAEVRAATLPIRLEVRNLELSTGPARQSADGAIISAVVAALERLDHSKVHVLRPPTEDIGKISSNEFDYRLLLGGDAHGIHARLVSAKTNNLIWSRLFHVPVLADKDHAAVFADQIVQCLWVKLFSVPRSSPETGHKEKGSARAAYLKGRYFWARRNEDGLIKAVSWFKKAIDEDPKFALPYSGLADALTSLCFYEIFPPSRAMPEAESMALRAIELSPDLAEAHASLADIYMHFHLDWDAADQEYRRAIVCNPGYALGFRWYANLLAARGQHEAAQIAITHAMELEPTCVITLVWAGVISYMARRFDDAVRYYRSALELDPHFIWAHLYLAHALEQKEAFPEALRELEIATQLGGTNICATAMKAYIYAAAGDKFKAHKILRELGGMPADRYMPSYDIAATYTALGDFGHAIQWLKRAYGERYTKLFMLTQDPRFDPLRHRRDFQQIEQQVGLTSYSKPFESSRMPYLAGCDTLA